MNFQKIIKKYIFERNIIINNAEYMLHFFEDNISEGYTIFSYTKDLSIKELRKKIKIALKIIQINSPLNDINCKDWNDLFNLLETILKNETLNVVGWTKEEFQIDLVTLTLEPIVENMKK